ncbi:MAG: efflux RND transporter permease subunit [Pseudomonadota bacterium]
MNGLIALFTRHPNAANVLMVLMLVVGGFSLANLTTRFWPPANLQEVEILISWPGASAEDVASNVLDAVEPAVRFLPDVDSIWSRAREGSAFTTITFAAGADMQKALGEVEQAIAAITTFPQDSETPVVRTDAIRDPVAKVGVAGPFPESALQIFAREVRDDLLNRGLDRVTLGGMREREIIVDAREHDLMRHGLTPSDIASAIRANTRDRPSGVLEGLIDRQVRVLGDEETPAAIASVVLMARPSGESLTIGDVATVRDTFSRSGVSGMRGGDPAIELTIQRAQTDDALQSEAIVREYIEDARDKFPQSLKIQLYDVRTAQLWDRISILVRNGWQGLAIVLVVLFLFLQARIAFWVAVGIPVAFAGTLAVMLATGQTINMISLFALIMMIGVIVDDAIVVGEHADTLSGRGYSPEEAAEHGAREMLVPVFASSFTTIAAFAPIFMMRDVLGQMMHAMPLVGISIIIASLIECFLILPGHLAHSWGRPTGLQIGRFLRLTLIAGVGAIAIAGVIRAVFWLTRDANPEALRALLSVPPLVLAVVAVLAGLVMAGILERKFAARAGRPARASAMERFRTAFDTRFNRFRDGAFSRFVRLTHAFRYTTLAIAVGSATVVIYGVYIGGGHVQFIFFPAPEAEFIRARIDFHPGTPRERVVEGVAKVEAALRDAELDLAGGQGKLVTDVYALIGRSGRHRGDNLATLNVQLTASEDRDIRTPTLVRAWRRAVPHIAGVKRVSVSERRGGIPGRDIHLRLASPSTDNLKAASSDAMVAIADIPGVSGVSDNLPLGKPEVVLSLTPRGEALGFTADNVGRQVRAAFQGEIARRLALNDEEVPIRVRQRSDGESVALEELFLRTRSGTFVPLTEVATMRERDTFSTIVRRDGLTTIAVVADVDSAITTPQEVTELIAETVLPRLEALYGVEGEFRGRARDRRRSFEDLRQGAYLSAAVIYLTLAFVFGSYWRPLVIMLIIPFGAVGAILGHVLLDMKLTIISFVGLLGLAGILVNDSIILVRRFDERLRAGEAPDDAAVAASADRLRAVLLTSLTTIGGLFPLLFETSLSAQFLLPMAVTMVFGLALATIIVLVLVPALLGVGFDIGRTATLLIGRKTGTA